MNGQAPPLALNDLLLLSGIDPAEVLVFRHRPAEPALNRIFDWLVVERPDLFDSYQSTHGPKTEAALLKARYVAAFIRHTPKTALFVGLYEVAASRVMAADAVMMRPLHQELIALGLTGTKAIEGRESFVEFTLDHRPWHADWQGRLVIDWPGLERSWYRWADRNIFPVRAIADQSVLIRPMPDWHDLLVEWQDLALLPTSWRAALSQWRGIYLIIDQVDGRQYVGSASGQENILQRWRNYSRTGHGGNKLLRNRDPRSFRFAILQRVSPDMPDSEVVAIEQSWKRRLRSVAPFGLNEN